MNVKILCALVYAASMLSVPAAETAPVFPAARKGASAETMAPRAQGVKVKPFVIEWRRFHALRSVILFS